MMFTLYITYYLFNILLTMELYCFNSSNIILNYSFELLVIAQRFSNQSCTKSYFSIILTIKIILIDVIKSLYRKKEKVYKQSYIVDDDFIPKGRISLVGI